MPFVQPPFPAFVNFKAATRKSALIPSGYFSPNDSTSWIWGPAGASVPVGLVGTVDGVNAVFTSASGNVNAVFKNGVLQDPGVMYTVSGVTVTFLDPYIPRVGDVIQALAG